MVKKLFLVLALAVVAYLASACGGSGNNTAAPKPTVTNTPLAQVFRATIAPESGPPGTEVTITGTGWGPGDAIWACDNKRGNCTDYHSLLIERLRAALPVSVPLRDRDGLPKFVVW